MTSSDGKFKLGTFPIFPEGIRDSSGIPHYSNKRIISKSLKDFWKSCLIDVAHTITSCWRNFIEYFFPNHWHNSIDSIQIRGISDEGKLFPCRFFFIWFIIIMMSESRWILWPNLKVQLASFNFIIAGFFKIEILPWSSSVQLESGLFANQINLHFSTLSYLLLQSFPLLYFHPNLIISETESENSIRQIKLQDRRYKKNERKNRQAFSRR